jgi:hypothetical protein
MDKFLITRKSQNPITGPILVTTSPRRTCPLSCPLRKTADTAAAGACYAEHGMLGGFIWTALDRTPAGGTFQKGRIKVHSFDELLAEIRNLPAGSVWRHNQAGDLPTDDQITIDRAKLDHIVAANQGRRGFTFTHFDVIENVANRDAVADANARGFTINLSGNALDHADALAETACGPVTTLVPSDQPANTATPAGRKVVICPARTHAHVTCSSCRLCTRQRDFIIAFPALGRGRTKISGSGQ